MRNKRRRKVFVSVLEAPKQEAVVEPKPKAKKATAKKTSSKKADAKK